MRIEDLSFDYPKELVAMYPKSPRDAAKLLVYEKSRNKINHSDFRSLGQFLKKGDVLVLNKTKVFPARVFATSTTDHQVEVLFLKEISPRRWEILIGGRISDAEELKIGQQITGILEKGSGKNILKVNVSKKEMLSYLEKEGHVPLPPYIKRKDDVKDKSEYQTIFAKKIGSAAAPTAGLHFTKRLLASLKKQGIEITYVTLHVGLGTFAPIKVDKVEDHDIHTEYFEIDKKTTQVINNAKKESRRVIACGTTVVRALESAGSSGRIVDQKSDTKLFILPGYKFKIVDGLITNFHTPRSSLLCLVYAFLGKANIQKIYRQAIKDKYRLFSYGDGMLLLK